MSLKKFYKNLYPLLPKSFQGNLSKISFNLGKTPSAKQSRNNGFPNGAKGGFVISADFELA